MVPDDLPIDPPAEDSTKPTRAKDSRRRIGPEAEVRGGSEEPENAPPIEQQKREEQAKP